jgi:NhaA family Na+:H+ antiporter
VALAVDFPTQELHPVWLLASVVALALVWGLFARHARPGASELQHRRAAHLWPYALAGLVTWTGVVLAGLPGALGLLPLVPLVPHAERSFGLFAEAEALLHDPLSRLAQLMVRPLPVILFLFGLTRGGLDVQALGPMTVRVLLAFWLGKPLGLLIGAALAMLMRGGRMPEGLRLSDLILIAVLSGMGLTVPLLALDSALPGGFPADQARAGLALSLGFGALALGLGRLFGTRRP